MLLSILIPTLESRKPMLDRLLAILQPQLTTEVEVVLESDNGKLSIGEKRNRLLAKAIGDYVCFVDDDDTVSDDYVSELLSGIAAGVDVVSIQGIFTINGQFPAPFRDLPYQSHCVKRVGGVMEYSRGVQHLDAIRRLIALSAKFPLTSFAEDYDWGTALERTKLIKTWRQVDHHIYFYDYRYPKVDRLPSDLAIVMPCLNHAYVTHKAVESLLHSTDDPNFLLVLVDDGSTDDTPDLARDLQKQIGNFRFHYVPNGRNLGVNPSWNIGITVARARNAKHIAVVNNDVLFSPKWDIPLREALQNPGVGVVSPMSTFGQVPGDWPRGTYRSYNPAGYMGYMPILGCCFMFRSDLVDKIGPFPEIPRIYFGDNWLVQATQNAGLECGYETESYVHHLFCLTTVKLDNDRIWKEEGPQFDALAESMRPLVPFAPPPLECVQ